MTNARFPGRFGGLIWLGACALALAPSGPPALAQLPPAATEARVPSGIEVSNGEASVRVTAITDSVLRVRLARAGAFPEDSSWAVPSEVRRKGVAVQPAASGFSTAQLTVRVDPRTLQLTVSDRQGRTVHSDLPQPVSFEGRGFTLRKALPNGERYFGLGDKTGPFDRRGASYVHWNTDAWGYGTATDPVYKSIPFFVSTGGSGGAYGLFLDNSWRSWFDFGHREEGTLALGAPGGPVDYYVIAGPSVRDVVRRYTDLTGKAPLTPLWGLGYQQSRYSYMTEAEVRELAQRLKADRIPTDVIWLDIDFQDRNRPFTVNRKAFPDLAGLARHLRSDGIKLVAITDLHIAHAPGEGYAPYDSGAAGNHFVRKADGNTYVAPVWPGPSVFPDFTRADTRRWWGDLYKGFVDDGIAGFWNDMNEPAVFETPTKTMPLDNIHRVSTDDFAPRDASHSEIHNVYGMENSRATFEGLQRLRPDLRPYVMTRATYAGGQRYAHSWTGDNNATWDHLKLMVQQLLNLGLSGFTYAGADIGGFTGGPSPELLTRWYQVGAFTPVFRNHSAKDTPRAEPWVDGPRHLAIRRAAIEERYRLMPYFYSVAEEHSRTGDPIMRPVFYDYPSLMSAPCDQSMAFTVGRDLLVAPSPKPESPQPYDVCLPAAGWYDYWTGLRVDGERVKETPSLERLPLFVRAGAILPRQPLTQSTAERPSGPLELHVYPGPECRGELYADDGVSVAHRRGGFLRQAIRCHRTAEGLVLEFGPREGGHAPWWSAIAVTVHDWSGGATVGSGSRRLRPELDPARRTLRLLMSDQRRAATVRIVRT
ncbi:MAG TPA: TIM-barrel domain-containing protein [Sphingomicrobium sp.]|nr:TIM-barrel domain-containing protein [Sphingomicrobium sp.]